MQVIFTDVLRGQNTASKVRLSYLDVPTEAGNFCWRFKDFKAKTCDAWCIRRLKTTKKEANRADLNRS